MSRLPQRAASGSTVLLAGWLFADLLLLLLVIALGSLPREERTGATPAPTVPSPPASTQPAQRGLVLKPCSFTVRTGSAASVRKQFGAQLGRAGVADRTAGFVLSFGTAPDPGPGQEAAERVNSIVTDGFSRFEHAPKRGYWKGGPSGRVRIDVFFLATPDGDTSFPKRCRSSDDEDG
ncbi:hypothetical protein [Streptomyces griseomycini]|uniref:Uncharacterized protein n=1 Tax=Streptomyces griseomycini TaxID=66895 RepID=A0A7W7PUM4_9ACTN|nr:hypothetical protein [Streptomyces griseomycini]MBB4901582.1 hypothetical protein [Streptomyces griseomycini]GGQ22027.1 hypothetical protein GCM10010266_51450 [Streptomyces griseomycini]GGR44582.1 hypothetical protein GCM10015536_58130 [Streptomyces griseomycini]